MPKPSSGRAQEMVGFLIENFEQERENGERFFLVIAVRDASCSYYTNCVFNINKNFKLCLSIFFVSESYKGFTSECLKVNHITFKHLEVHQKNVNGKDRLQMLIILTKLQLGMLFMKCIETISWYVIKFISILS